MSSSFELIKEVNLINRQFVEIRWDNCSKFESKNNVYAKVDLAKDQIVIIGVPLYEVATNTMHSLYIDYNKLVIFQDEFIFISHSCDPNLKILDNEHGGYNLYAVRDIKAGELLSWNYTSIENNISSIDNCLCGTKHCVGKLLNIDQFTDPMYLKYKAKYLSSQKPLLNESDKYKFKVAVVTGASRGIGRETCINLAKAGLYIVGLGRNQNELDSLKNEIMKFGGVIRTYDVDVSDYELVKHTFNNIYRHFGKIDILINNAGSMFYNGILQDTKNTIDEYQQMISTNCNGVVYCTHSVLPYLLINKEGVIINISSDAGKTGFEGLSVYCGTKHFVEGFSKTIRKELKDKEIKIINIQPGDVKTEIISNNSNIEAVEKYSGEYNDEILKPIDISRTILFILESSKFVSHNEILIQPISRPI